MARKTAMTQEVTGAMNTPGIGHNGPPSDFQDRLAELLKQEPEALLRLAHKTLLANLTASLEEGAMSAANMELLRQFLKDNGMVLSVGGGAMASTPAVVQEAPLPVFDDEPDYTR